MTPKEKARFLIDRFNHFDNYYYHESFKDTDLGKQCALIAVDEILFITKMYNDTYAETTYWQEVKKEIELL